MIYLIFFILHRLLLFLLLLLVRNSQPTTIGRLHWVIWLHHLWRHSKLSCWICSKSVVLHGSLSLPLYHSLRFLWWLQYFWKGKWIFSCYCPIPPFSIDFFIDACKLGHGWGSTIFVRVQCPLHHPKISRRQSNSQQLQRSQWGLFSFWLFCCWWHFSWWWSILYDQQSFWKVCMSSVYWHCNHSLQ